MTELDAEEARESPLAVTALMLIVVDTPVGKPAIVNGLVVCAGENAVYVMPSVEYL